MGDVIEREVLLCAALYHDTHHPNEDQTCETNEKVQSASFTNRSLPVNSPLCNSLPGRSSWQSNDPTVFPAAWRLSEKCFFFLSQLRNPTVEAHLDVGPCFALRPLTSSSMYTGRDVRMKSQKAPSRAALNGRPAYWRTCSSCKWGERPLFKWRSQWAKLD